MHTSTLKNIVELRNSTMRRPSSTGTRQFSATNCRVALLAVLGLGLELGLGLGLGLGLKLELGLVYRVRVRFGVTVSR